ncbi:MAG: ATP-binding cassette domain-containing protein [Chthoniobacterales bacterium]
MSHAIEVGELCKTYEGGVEALRGISFSVDGGSVFALLGPNGAGKTTAIKILTTLSKATSGFAMVDGIDVEKDPQRVRESIGVISQRSGADIDATGRENLFLQGRLFGVEKNVLAKRVDELLDRFGLADADDRFVRTYSGGMQRKLDVAMGVVQRPKILFLDEPTIGLDPEARIEIWDEIARLASGEEMTILLTTHYLEEADNLAASLAIVDNGEIVVTGTPHQLKQELRGDAIRANLAESAQNGKVESALASIDRVHDIEVDGTELRARAEDGAAAVPRVLSALDSAGVTVASITVARPSLDDVYLQHTGRRFDGEGAESE